MEPKEHKDYKNYTGKTFNLTFGGNPVSTTMATQFDFDYGITLITVEDKQKKPMNIFNPGLFDEAYTQQEMDGYISVFDILTEAFEDGTADGIQLMMACLAASAGEEAAE